MDFYDKRIINATWLVMGWALWIAGCRTRPEKPDAYGHFEATEILISAETSGKIIAWFIEEGDTLSRGQPVGIIDTTFLSLQKKEWVASRQALEAQIRQAEAQVAALNHQRLMLEKDLSRTEVLVQASAAPQKQWDDLEGTIRIIEQQQKAAIAQKEAAAAQKAALNQRIRLVEEQIARSILLNPIRGRVLETYVRRFETTTQGRPLYKIADLDTMILRAYLSGKDLDRVRIGQACRVWVDQGHGGMIFPGRISWISSQAEFTPKTIQTREERVHLVYAMKVVVPNDGTIKIGMVGEVFLK